MKKIPVPIYCHRFAFSAEAQDDNQHVNNIEYVRMLQESAIAHTRQNGWAPEELYARGWTWVVRSHFIEYLKPCRAGEEIALYTWAASFKKIRSLRRYRFVRVADRAVLALSLIHISLPCRHCPTPTYTPERFARRLTGNIRATCSMCGFCWTMRASLPRYAGPLSFIWPVTIAPCTSC